MHKDTHIKQTHQGSSRHKFLVLQKLKWKVIPKNRATIIANCTDWIKYGLTCIKLSTNIIILIFTLVIQELECSLKSIKKLHSNFSTDKVTKIVMNCSNLKLPWFQKRAILTWYSDGSDHGFSWDIIASCSQNILVSNTKSVNSWEVAQLYF